MTHESHHRTIPNLMGIVGLVIQLQNTGLLIWKGREVVYENTLGLGISIDISSVEQT